MDYKQAFKNAQARGVEEFGLDWWQMMDLVESVAGSFNVELRANEQNAAFASWLTLIIMRRMRRTMAANPGGLKGTPEVDALINSMLEEYVRATGLHPKWPKSAVKCSAILIEEAGELVRAALKYEDEQGAPEEIERELVQVGAMVIRFYLYFQAYIKK